MRYAYIVVVGALFAIGAWYVLNDLTDDDLLRGVGAVAGLAVMLTATLNLLNHAYGVEATGVRVAAPAANLALLLMLWTFGRPTHWPTDWLEYVLTALLIAATALSVRRERLSNTSITTRPRGRGIAS